MGKKSSLLSAMYTYIPHSRKELLSFAYGIIIAFTTMLLYAQYTDQSTQSVFLKGSNTFEALPIPMDPFPEPAWRTPNTLNVKVVTSTPFARFEIHQVK